MRFYSGLAALIASAFLTTAAFACEVKGSSFIWGSDSDVTMYMSKGESCGVGLQMRGGMVDSINVVEAPKNGTAGAVSLSAFGYRPKPGFVGSDGFKVRAVGSDNRSKGPIIFSVTVLVK